MTEKEKVNSNKLSSETVSGEEQMRAISGMSEEEIMAMKRETQELMEEIDTESKTRIYTGPWKTFLLGFSVFWVVFSAVFYYHRNYGSYYIACTTCNLFISILFYALPRA